MKNPPRPRRKPAALLLALLTAVTGGAALAPTEWRQRQVLPITTPGLTRLTVPAATLDAAQPDLADLRLIDAQGQEVPYLLDRDQAVRGMEAVHPIHPRSFRTAPTGDTTQLVFETGTAEPLDAIDLETSVPFFLKAAHVDVSPDGQEWRSLGPAVPVFRQFGAEQLRLGLDRRQAAFIRVTLDDFHSRQVAFTGARLRPAPTRAAPPPLAPLGAQVTRRDEFAGETVLTVTLDGRHVLLGGLTFDATDPLFMRRVTVAIREVQGAVSAERTIGSGTIYRIALDGAPLRTQLELPLEFIPPTRELLVHIHNGDSPPLQLERVRAGQRPVNLLFLAPTTGSFALLTGNPQAVAPHYDLAAFAGEMRGAGPRPVLPGELAAMPDYHPRESLGPAPLPDVPLAGAPLDVQAWTQRKTVHLAQPGVQELELDLETLARARSDYADLRLLRHGNQIPYVLEQPALSRALTLEAEAVPDAKRPAMSVWRLALPQAGRPIRRLVLASATPLFQRHFRIYEKTTTPDGRTFEDTIATGDWSRTPDPGVLETRVFELQTWPRTTTLWIETDNGDNPPIALGAVQAIHPVVRLVFKTAETDGFSLAFGNPRVGAPRYDLSLVALKLLTASRNVAHLAPPAAADPLPPPPAGLDGGYVFWGALALVVIVLLVIVAKLLPIAPVPK